jgi:1-deoxy-D-xylulose-5-phosphate reductoisomerase
MKTLSILGSTGSIGRNVLEVVRINEDRFKIFALSCYKNVELLKLQCLEFNPNFAVVSSEIDAKILKEALKNKVDTEVLFQQDSYSFIARHDEVTHVIASISGAAGLLSTYAAAKAGKEILLANKESLVMAGPLILSEVLKNNSKIIPIDSEHNAIYQLLDGEDGDISQVKKIILTASGGPFLNDSVDKIANATVTEALNHPNWNMGDKITIDSATMMNKGLEVIEAFYLFNLPSSKIDVIVHPQSVIHSMVEYIDGSIVCQLGFSDMKIPISYSLGYPKRINSGLTGINLSEVEKLTFFKPDFKKFSCLSMAYEVLNKNLSHSIVLNIANELAVNEFLKNKIKFFKISETVNFMLNSIESDNILNIDDVLNFSEIVKNKTYNYLSYAKNF